MANLVGNEGSDDTFVTPKKNRKQVRAILGSLKKGATMEAACEAAGITRMTLWRWRRQYPRLQALIETIQDARVDEVEDAMFKAAKEGNTTAGMFILTRRKSEKWPDRSLISNVINIKNGRGDDREFEGRDADEQRQLAEYFRQAERDSAQ